MHRTSIPLFPASPDNTHPNALLEHERIPQPNIPISAINASFHSLPDKVNYESSPLAYIPLFLTLDPHPPTPNHPTKTLPQIPHQLIRRLKPSKRSHLPRMSLNPRDIPLCSPPHKWCGGAGVESGDAKGSGRRGVEGGRCGVDV